MIRTRIGHILVFLLLTLTTHAQRGYECWIDNDYEGRMAGTQASNDDVSLSVDISALPPGLHFFNYHAQDSVGAWGTLNRSPFVKNVTGCSYEYWIDEDYAHRTTGQHTGEEMTTSVDISHLSPGFHVFSYRTQTAGGGGTLCRQLFKKGTVVSGYEYWFDENYAKRKMMAQAGDNVTLSFNLDEVPAGIHSLNLRPRTSDGTEGPAAYLLFVNELKVTAYEYWFDDDIAHKVVANATGNDLQLPISVSHLSGDAHYLNFRAKHADGTWGTLMRKGFVLKSNITGYDYAFGNDSAKHVDVTSTAQLVMQNQPFAIPEPKVRTVISDTTTIKIDTAANTAMTIRRDTTDFSIFFRNDEGRVSEVQSSEVAVADTLLRELPEIPLFGRIKIGKADSCDFRGFHINVPDSDTYVLSTTQESRLMLYDGEGQRIDNLLFTTNTLPMKPGRYYGIIYNMQGSNDSLVVSYAIDNNIVAKPVITHEGNRIAISTTTANATIHYTMDGTKPDATSAVYTDTITVNRNCIIKAIAVRENYEDSEIDSLVIDWFKVPNVYFAQDGRIVTLSNQMAEAMIWYRLSESESDAGIQYGDSLVMSEDCTIYAWATREGFNPSDTTSLSFVAANVTVATPLIENNGAKVGISTTTDEAVIYYTIDGTEPTAESTVYTDSITVERNCTIKAIAMRKNWFNSDVATKDIDIFRVPNVHFAQDGRIVKLSNQMAEAKIWYRLSTSGSDAGIQYGDSLVMSEDCIIYAWATREGFNPSDTTSLSFVAANVTVATPLIENNGAKVGISTTTEEAVIYYTIDGTEPTAESTVYTDSITVERNCTVKAIAMRQNWFPSEVTTFEFVAPIEATFDGRVLAVGGSTTMTDALESVGGRDEVAKTITAIVWNSSATLTNSDLQGLDNPNLLIYVNERSQAPQNRNNVVVNGLAMNVVLSDTGSGNCDFYAPQTFTAEMITYSREFKQATQVGVCRGWETISLPFMVQTITHADNGVITPFGIDTSNKHFWLRQLSTNGLVSATKIEANLPYLISMPNDEKNYAKEYILKGLVTFSAQNAVVPKTEPTALALADSSIVMVPALQSVGKSSTVWALNVGQERSQYFEGSTFERDYHEVRPFEAYTVHRSDTPAPRFLPINDLMNSTTGIETISNIIMSHDNYYRLDGRKVDGKPTKKGLYITNGRKVVVK